MATIHEWINMAAEALANSGIVEPRREAASLIAFALKADRAYLIVNANTTPNPTEEELIRSLVERRVLNEPLQYIVGKQEFYGLDFKVAPGVLIPRPETEFAVEESIRILNNIPEPQFCEIGVGSGCISVSILKNIPAANAIAVDISADALSIAKLNADEHNVGNRLQLLQSDVFSALQPREQQFDLIVSNPPYIPAEHIDGLQPEVNKYEPHIALTDGFDGTTLIKKIIDGAPELLRKGGFLVMEIGFSQSEEVLKYFSGSIWKETKALNDLQGIPRIISAKIIDG